MVVGVLLPSLLRGIEMATLVSASPPLPQNLQSALIWPTQYIHSA